MTEQTIFPPSTSKFNTYKWLTILLVGVVLYLAFCNKPPIPEPIVKTVHEQHDIYVHDTIEHRFNVDSINKIIEPYKQQAEYWHNAFNVSGNEVVILQNSLSDYIAHTVIPDTCKSIVANIQQQFDRVIASNKAASIACTNTINFKDLIIGQKDVLIKEDSIAYRKMVDNVDTALVIQGKLQKYINKIKPKTEITIGASAYGYNQWGVGLNLGVRNRVGTTYEIGVMQLGTHGLNYSVSIKKPLVKF